MFSPSILDLPEEILSNVISFLKPEAVVRFGQTCRHAHRFTSPPNQILWRSVFLHVFDDPEEAWSNLPTCYESHRNDWDWHLELKRRLLAIRALYRRYAVDEDGARYEQHIQAILSMIDTAKFCLNATDLAQGKIPQADDRSSLNIQALALPLQQSYHAFERFIFDSGRRSYEEEHTLGRPRTRSMALAAREKNRPESASRLHALYGLTMREHIEPKTRGAARRKVYNWNLTSEETDYGPFCLDGSGKVNWSLLEGACSCISRSFELCVDGHLSMPQGLYYCTPHRSLADPTNAGDWARAEGMWLGTYAFLDYADLFSFNVGIHMGLGRIPDLNDEPEACGDLMKLETKIDDSVREDPKLRTKVPMSKSLPPIYFSGGSRGQGYITHPMTSVKGFAALLPGGREVRWKFIVAYQGVDQWQLEGVQPGGIRSGGVYGIWSQVDHEETGPIGPFCYFPAELCKPTSIVLAG